MTTTTHTTELVTVDPSTVILEANVRTGAQPSESFIESIKTHGVLTPVLGRRNSDGIIEIRAGQLRTLAAREANVPLPVLLVEVDENTTQPEWERIAQQIVENEQRTNLTTGQKVAAYRAMELDGLSATKIAGTLSTPKAEVKAALTIAKTANTLAIANTHDIDLLQLASLTEFEDEPDTLERLTEVATDDPTQLEHSLSRARKDRENRLTREAKEAELRAEGVTVFTHEEVDNDENHIAYLNQYTLDPEFTDDPNAEGGLGVLVDIQWYNGTTYIQDMIKNPELHGYTKRVYSSEDTSGPMTEEAKEERRRVIRCNKASDAADPVRIAWVTSFLTRKSFPQDAGQFIIVALLRYANNLNTEHDGRAHELLGVTPTPGYRDNALADLVERNPAKAGLVTLALILGKFEATMSRNTWRQPSDASKAYLVQLRAWGYVLADVEKVALGELTDVPHEDATPSQSDLSE